MGCTARFGERERGVTSSSQRKAIRYIGSPLARASSPSDRLTGRCDGFRSISSIRTPRTKPTLLGLIARQDGTTARGTIQSSGVGPGHHQPRSMTWGGHVVTPAPSGRARDRAKGPADSRNSSDGLRPRLMTGIASAVFSDELRKGGNKRQAAELDTRLQTRSSPIRFNSRNAA